MNGRIAATITKRKPQRMAAKMKLLHASSPRHGKLGGMMPVAVRMTRVSKMIMSTSQIIRQISKVISMVLGREGERMND